MTDSDSQRPLPIVGIGASAGGLSALQAFFGRVPPDSGLAFVVVVHLSPEHESHLPELLQPHVSIPVEQVQHAVPLEANRVYVIPPNANLDTIDTHLRLSELEELRHERAPVDHFFRTLAETHDGAAIGVVLTGTGADGTLGLGSIRQKGGLTIVQEPSDAEYDGMPRSAIDNAPVDLVLPLTEIPSAIFQYASVRPRLEVSESSEETESSNRQFLRRVFGHVRTRTGRDFSHYKPSTILRRIARRMQFAYIEQPEDYLAYLREDTDEVHALADDLLITVTSFFRDAEAFDVLERDVVPRLFENKDSNDGIRVWSAGCATGEEAYSLAILLLEEAQRRELSLPIQIFASDMHDGSLERAREGRYPGDIETDVSPERLSRFFVKESDGYRIRSEVRECVVFTPHNLLADPPFSRLDLISCRNLMIYLRRDLQRQVIELFHYALNSNGFLVLGTAETLEGAELFRTEDKKCCVFQKRDVPGPEPRLRVFPVHHRSVPSESPRPVSEAPHAELHHRVLELFAPPSLLVSPDDRICHLSPHGGRFLIHPGGAPTTNVFRLLRDELRIEMRAVLSECRKKKAPVRSKPAEVSFDDTKLSVVLHARPAPDREHEGFVLVVLEETQARVRESEPSSDSDATHQEQRDRIDDLESEQEITGQRLQLIIEDYETGQEELRASNEELQSSNEELRSTLEELETSKEELQSMNEELQTLNQENRHKVDELAQLSGDLQNLMASTSIGTLFLDRRLCILRFTPQITELFNVRTSDRGRPISDFTHSLGYDQLQEDCKRVLENLVPIEREVRDDEGYFYLTRVLPYRSTEDRIMGVVITFIDITDRILSEQALRRSEAFHRVAVEAAGVGTWELNPMRDEFSLSPHMARFMGYAPHPRAEVHIYRNQKVSREHWLDSIHEEDRETVRAELNGAVELHGVFELEFRVVRPDGTTRWLFSQGRAFEEPETGLRLRGAAVDVTHQKSIEENLLRNEKRLADELQAMKHLHGLVTRLVWCPDLSSSLTEVLKATVEISGAERGSIHLRDPSTGSLEAVAEEGTELSLPAPSFTEDLADPLVVRTMGGERVVVEDTQRASIPAKHSEFVVQSDFRAFQLTPLLSRNGEYFGLLATYYNQPRELTERDLWTLDLYSRQAADLVERGRASDALHESEAQFRAMFSVAGVAAVQFNPTKGAILRVNDTFSDLTGYSHEELLASTLFEICHPEDVGTLAQRCRRLVEGGHEACQMELRFLCKDGSTFWGLIAANLVPHSPSARAVALLLDVTSRHEVESSLEEQNRHKDEFLAMLGHELRNPLAAIRNATELLKLTGTEEPRLERAYNSLDRQTSHMSRLIDGLLEISRIARGKVHIHFEPMDLREVLAALAEERAPQIAERGLDFSVHCPDRPVWVSGDQVRLTQVFDNLLGNALKFTDPPGSITITLEESDGFAVTKVKDSGVGIRKAVLRRIFEAFQQEAQDTARSEGGLGLGLALAKGLVDLHRGSLQARSEGQGKGAEFEVRLQLSEPPEDQWTPVSNSQIPRTQILVVEDNLDAAETLRELLEARGHEVAVVHSGPEALDLLAERCFQLVLCDLGLPGMDGYEVVRSIRRDPKLRDLQVVAVTGYGQAKDREETKEAGFDAHLVKPLSLQGLDELLVADAES